MITLKLGTKQDLDWAQAVALKYHYLHQRVDNRARPMVYLVTIAGVRLGLVMVGIPHATRCRGWWGYPGLPTQWQVLDLCRIWLDPAIQAGGEFARPGYVPGFVDRHGQFRPTVASWAIGQVLERLQRDWISLWPPVFPERPYHIRLVISYHDPKHHRGTIYRLMKALPMYTDKSKLPIPGPSGKFGWCWRLPEPAWEWPEVEIRQPRTMRLELGDYG
jgi:hypothetical protein